MKKKGQANVKGEDEDGLVGPEPLWPTLPHPPQAQIKGVTGEEHGDLRQHHHLFNTWIRIQKPSLFLMASRWSLNPIVLGMKTSEPDM